MGLEAGQSNMESSSYLIDVMALPAAQQVSH
jgi:hypothetical protein